MCLNNFFIIKLMAMLQSKHALISHCYSMNEVTKTCKDILKVELIDKLSMLQRYNDVLIKRHLKL